MSSVGSGSKERMMCAREMGFNAAVDDSSGETSILVVELVVLLIWGTGCRYQVDLVVLRD